jgi:hypothetical protein
MRWKYRLGRHRREETLPNAMHDIPCLDVPYTLRFISFTRISSCSSLGIDTRYLKSIVVYHLVAFALEGLGLDKKTVCPSQDAFNGGLQAINEVMNSMLSSSR